MPDNKVKTDQIKRVHSVLPGQGKESKVQQKLRLNREQREELELQNAVLDTKTRIHTAAQYKADVIELSNKVQQITTAVFTQEMLNKLEGTEAKPVKEKVVTAFRAYENDKNTADRFVKRLDDLKTEYDKEVSTSKDGEKSLDAFAISLEIERTVIDANMHLLGRMAETALNLNEVSKTTYDLMQSTPTTNTKEI